jgi:hypothetical protein
MNPLEAMEALLDLVRRAVREDLRQVVREELAAASAAPVGGMVDPATYGAKWSLCTATVRKAFREGRLPGERIGRAIRVRRDAAIGPSTKEPSAADAQTPAAIAERILRRVR